jgi:D-methionine transport system permease protein
MLHELLSALEETLFMVFSAGLLTWFIGLPLGALLAVTGPGKFLENTLVYTPLHFIIRILLSISYIVFMVAIIPLTHLIAGPIDSSGSAIIPLTLAAIPYFAKLSEEAISKIHTGLIEATLAIGASPLQIIYKVLIPEALPNIIRALTSTLIYLTGCSNIAGMLGAGGLGSLIIRKGYHSFHIDYVIAIVIIVIALVQIIQICGDYIANGSAHKKQPY